MYTFDAQKTKDDLVQWIRDWFENNGKDCNAVIGMSGGKDSTIMTALCVEALGRERVIGVGMPDAGQDLHAADEIAQFFGIQFVEANIGGMTSALKELFAQGGNQNQFPWKFNLSVQAEQNMPPRLRMVTLYAISQSNNGRVMGTCNLSENYIGYFTKFGDGASDVEPLAELTVTELLKIGDLMGIPYKWVHKIPTDDLPHSKSDEEKFGFTYETLDKYIRGIEIPDTETKDKIDRMHRNNAFKLRPVETFHL
ncbi:MAG: NAD(+) synthase [Bacteroidales bacterium]|nr:NAD(+) synthase [Bacteroidales bacterium]